MTFDDETSLPGASAPPSDTSPPTAADALHLIWNLSDLTTSQRDTLASTIRSVVRICRPEVARKGGNKAALFHAAMSVPMTCSYLNTHLFRAGSSTHGLEDASFDNLISRARTVLRHQDQHDPDLPKAADLPPAWKVLHGMLTSERQKGLIALFGYGARRGIEPTEMNDRILADFETWSTERVLHRDPAGRARRSASNWNWARTNLEGWPDIQLVRVGMRDDYTFPLASYPISFQEDVEAYLRNYACSEETELFPDEVIDPGYRSIRSQRQPRSQGSVDTRRYQIRQAAAALVHGGVPIDRITKLEDLVQPVDRVKAIILFHRGRTVVRMKRQQATEQQLRDPSVSVPASKQGIDLRDVRTSNMSGIGELLRQVLRFHVPVPKGKDEGETRANERRREGELRLMQQWIGTVKPPQQTSMTEKNALRIRELLEPRTYALLIHHPAALMHRAGNAGLKPADAARLALYAVALEILIFCPMRRANLAGLRLDRHLRRAREGGPITHFYIAKNEVKNRTAIDWPIHPDAAAMIETYIRDHRIHLAEPGNPFLFPGKGHSARSGHDLGIGLKERIERDLGVGFNVHAMRHLAVVRYLTLHPGQYETVRRILGHARITTTIAFYSGPEMDAAVKLFASVILRDRSDPDFKAGAVPRKSRPGRKEA